MLFPTLPKEANAVEWAPDKDQAEIEIPDNSSSTSVSIGIPSTIAFDAVTPTASGATTTATTNLTITTTNSASYSLYLYSSDGDNSLKSINPANTSTVDAINNGGVGLTLSSLEPNTWGYSLGTTEPTDTTTYSAVPTSNDMPIQTKDTSATTSANDTYTLSFGAKVDTSIPSGTYTGTLTVAVVAEPALVTIAFDGNGATSGSMSSIQMTPGVQQNLPSNAFSRTNHFFNGWNTNASGTGTSYTDGASYAAPIDSAGQTITLYAQWRTLINQLDDVTYMQDLTASHCANSDNGATATLRDRRDNNSYTIAKINGNCWMTQNLRIAGGTTLNSSTSNVVSSYTIPTTDLTTGNSDTEGMIHDSGSTTNGYWYNFCAASAGTMCSGGPGQAPYDICPKGWRLPTMNEFKSIISYMDIFSPVSGGYYNSGRREESNRGLWRASRGNEGLDYNSSSGSLSTFHFSLSRGVYIRCIRSI